MAKQISEPTLLFKRWILIKFLFEKVSEHNQEKPQSHTAAESRALWGTTKTINRPYMDFPAQIKKTKQQRFVCVCVGAYLVHCSRFGYLSHIELKSACMTVYDLVEWMWVGA